MVNESAQRMLINLPHPLPERATIGICAPSGAVDHDALARGIAAFEGAGHRVKLAPNTLSKWRYFAADDAARLSDLHALAADPEVDMIIAARGGYGWSRILHRVDWTLIGATRKIYCGFSDFTAFNVAALAKACLATFSGPMAASDFNSEDQDQVWMAQHFWPLLHGEAVRVAVPSPASADRQCIDAPLWGSNLAMLTHLAGTPFMPEIPAGILILEDIAESPYKIERMLLQLFHAGILAQQKAIILGQFSDCNPAPNNRYPYAMHEVVETLKALITAPIVSNFPFGHVQRKATLLMGVTARLEIQETKYSLSQRLAANGCGAP